MPEAGIDISNVPTSLTVDFVSQSQNATSYYWDFGDGSPISTLQNPTHNYQFSATYTVTHIVKNDCGADMVTMSVSPGGDVSIDEEFARSIQVVPNPFTVQTQIRFENPQAKAYALKVYDLQGKVVREYESSRGDHFTIDRGELSNGLYMYQLVGKEHSYTGKLILQ